jgi:transcriptional regulator with XRE-family HTH domain
VTTSSGPLEARRRLAAELRRYRSETNTPLEDVARALGWSSSKVCRIESGITQISDEDLKRLLTEYQVDNAETVEQLIALARDSRQQKLWWSRYKKLWRSRYKGIIDETAVVYEMATLVAGGSSNPLLLSSIERSPSAFEALSAVQVHSSTLEVTFGLWFVSEAANQVRQEEMLRDFPILLSLAFAREAEDFMSNFSEFNDRMTRLGDGAKLATCDGIWPTDHVPESAGSDDENARQEHRLAFLIALARMRFRQRLTTNVRGSLSSLKLIPYSRQVSPRDRMAGSNRSLRGPTFLRVSCPTRGMAMAA